MNEQQNFLAGLLSQVLDEQIKQSAILERIATQQTQLITAMAAEDGEEESSTITTTYLSGAPVRHWP